MEGRENNKDYKMISDANIQERKKIYKSLG
jgi:hypothetical protein